MYSAPGLMLRQTEALAHSIRSKSTSSVHNLYRKCIRDNIYGVLSHTFPCFVESIGPNTLCRLIDDFLLRHSALEPEFHHIATEFVQYAQQSQQVDALNTSVLEYEWTAFSVEIDPSIVTVSPTTTSLEWYDHVNAQPNAFSLSCNPTLRLLSLPFEITPRTVQWREDLTDTRYYGVFRNAQHQVISQKLRAIDVALIQMVNPIAPMNFLEFQRHTATHLTSFDALQWTQHFTKLGLTQLQALGGQHD